MRASEISSSAKSMDMRKYIKYIALCSIILTMSCQKHTYSPDGIFSEGGVISFSTRVETKAPIITELNGEHFGVYGYNFSNLTNWNTYKTTATPNVFHNLDVTCSETDGSCSYSVSTATAINGREQWELNKRYSYFAYYPYSSNASAISPSGATVIDSPYVEYALPISNGGTVDPDNLLDIMTSKVTDYSATQGTTVRFSFYHRLFCIDLHGQNFNATDISLSDLSMTISGIHYHKTKIFLDRDLKVPSVPEKPMTTGDNPTAITYTTTFPISASSTLTAKADAISLSGDKNIMLIPQNSSIAGSTGLTVEIKFKIGNATEYTTRTATYNVDFQEGKKYSLTLNFIGNDVILVAADAAPWEKKDVTHTFD